MHYTKGKTFHDRKKLQCMLILRSLGKSLTYLANYYNCDHSSILYQCAKWKVEKGSEIPDILDETGMKKIQASEIHKYLDKQKSKFKYQYLFDEKINTGKNCYKDYLKDKALKSSRLKNSRLPDTLVSNSQNS